MFLEVSDGDEEKSVHFIINNFHPTDCMLICFPRHYELEPCRREGKNFYIFVL